MTPLVKYYEAAGLLGVSLSTMKRLVRQGMIRKVPVGQKSIRFDPEDLVKLVNRLKQSAPREEILIEQAKLRGLPSSLESSILLGNGLESGRPTRREGR